MAISEAARRDLYTGLCEAIGPERAETLMSAIPIHDFDAVVTKADLRAEMAELHAEMLSEIGSLRNTMTNWFMMQSVAVIGAILSAIVGVALLT